jgi:hypothetical protein
MRRTALFLGAMLVALFAVSGAAWAINTIYCSDPQNVEHGICWGTPWRDVIIGTDKGDEISSEAGNDIVRGGRRPDRIHTGDSDWCRGKDKNYGGPGDDRLGGHTGPEKHYGGSENDIIADYFSTGALDYISCGRGFDYAYYNEGVDTVEADCEVQNPPQPE